MTDSAPTSEQAPKPPDPSAILKSRSFLALLALGAIIGVPVATVAYFFLEAVAKVQTEIFTDLPMTLGFHSEPLWWPLPWLALSGVLVALAIRYLPGTGGHEPSEGFKSGAPVQPIELFGIVAAAFATLSLGVVLGPEAPLIAIGSGLGVLAVHLVKRRRTTHDGGRHRGRRELCRHRHVAGLAPRGRLPAHGDDRAGGPDDGDRAGPGSPRRRCGLVDLRGPQPPDGIRDVLTDRAPPFPTSGHPRGPSSSGPSSSVWRPPWSPAASSEWPECSGPSPSDGGCW